MNFVKLYIGDYMRDTGTLTVAEHGAYVLMLLHHYATERPLPAGRELHRLLRAESKTEREAIDRVASRFWTATDAGLVNGRADREMKRAEHQRDVNRSVGKLGGRPKRMETESVSDSIPNHNPNQTPDTRHQTRERAEDSPPPPARAHEASPEPSDPATGHDPTIAGRICRAMRAAGLQATNPGDPRLLALIDQGATEAEFVGVAADAAKSGKGWAWALKALEGRRADAVAIALAPPPSPTVQGESTDAYRERVRREREEAAKRISAPSKVVREQIAVLTRSIARPK